MMNYFNIIFSNKSVLRNLQEEKFKNLKFNGKCIEFGANDILKKNFLKPNLEDCEIKYSNISSKNRSFVRIDLQKKIKTKIKFDNVIIFNVIEHLPNPDFALGNITSIIKNNGQIVGSIPFLFRIHGAPKDYSRLTKQNIKELLKKNNFSNIKIDELGTGPFLASISLLRSYLKYLPFIYQLLIFFAIVTDKFLNLIMNTNPKELYPIGYIFSAVKK